MKKTVSFMIVFILFTVLFFNINVSASEVTDVSFSYCRSDVWNDFSGKVLFSDYMDCIRIQTDKKKDYYLSYKTWNEGKDGYYPAVNSNVTDSEEFAGASGRKIRNISISVCDKEGSPVTEGIVVMYRAFVDGVWLPWVSNADSDWMNYVQRKYKLDGVLDTKSGNAGINSSYISGIQIHIFEEQSIDDTKRTDGKSKLIDAPFISQVEEFPTGCESVSAVMALRHYGYDISVDDFIDNYLEKDYPDNFDPNICFGGDPKSNSGIGCYSPVIQKAVEKVLDETTLTAKLISGLSLEELCEEYIDQGIPVIVWATSGMQKAATGKIITYEDRKIQWIVPEHCLLLVGYDEENYIFNDPQKNEFATYYSKNISENAFCALGCQAVAIANKPLPDENFSISETSYNYDGKVKTPVVTVKDIGGNILIKDTDYTVSYSVGRKDVGTYKVTVKMRGNYTGSKVLSFKINPISISKCGVSLSTTSYTYNGKVKTPTVVVKDAKGTTLTKNTDYTVTYATGRKNVGTYKITVKMKGNYTGSKVLSFKINPVSISKCGVSLSTTSYTYNAKVKTPTVVVKDAKGTTLTKNTDYTVTYDTGRKNVGTYKITVKMRGNYTGSKVLSFKINPISISKCGVSLSTTSYTYNGKVKTPAVVVKDAKGTTLTKNTDYTATYDTGRKNVGTYNVTVKMKGNYSGTKVLKFKINPPKTIVSKLTSGKKSLKVNISKKSTQVTGYQIQYSTTKSFKSYKTKTVSSYKTTLTALSGLSANKTYYVRVRTYKTVSGIKYYSAWSAYKYKKTK